MFQDGLIASRQGLKSRETITRHGGKADAAGKVIIRATSRALSVSAVIKSDLDGLIASRQGLKSRETITRHGGKADAAGKVIIRATSRALSVSAVIKSNLLLQHNGLCGEKNRAAV